MTHVSTPSSAAPAVAAHALEGLTLKGKWRVIKKLEPKPGSTGGFFSVCYIVEDSDGEAFLKALDFHAFFQIFAGKSIVDIVQEQSNAFKYEKELLHRCRNKRLSKVSTVIDEGEETIAGFAIPNVPYLIFEMANGDVRSHIDFAADLNYAWKLRSLHNVAVGLSQLHSANISHQDLKPSNVLLYDNTTISKIGDLGRSLCGDIKAPHENGLFPGDLNYAPPEHFYRYTTSDWDLRTKTTDMYLFGSLAVFYFIGVNMTTLTFKHLANPFQPNVWTGTYLDIQPYLVDAFGRALAEFRDNIGNNDITEDLVKLVEYCCNPIPEQRGHPKTLTNTKNQFDFTRIVSLLDIYARKAEIKLL